MSNTPGEDPSSVPFQPSQPLGSPHTTSRERGLYTFVRGMMNRSVDEGDRAFAVLTSLDPSNLLAMCQRSLGEYTVEKKSTSVRFTHLGFEQSLVLGLTPKAGSSSSDDPAAPAPMPLVELRVLQCDSCDNAAKAFTNYVGLFQRTWSDVIKRTRNRGLGDYASETDTSIFWTQLSAFVVLEILPEHPKDMSPGEGSIDARAVAVMHSLSSTLDQTFQGERGRASAIRKATMLPLDTSNVEVGKGTTLKLKFGPGAHPIKRIQLKQPSPLMLGGDITVPSGQGDDGTQGELQVYGLKEGSATLTVQVAHGRSLHVESEEFTLNVVSASSSG